MSDFDPTPGVCETLEAGVRRVLAPNPSPMTFRGTNTYIVGTGDVALIDPGPLDRSHLDAILAALSPGERISHILITHSHVDHSPLAGPLSAVTGAPVYAFGPSHSGRSAIMQELAATGLAGGGEGIDESFVPDEILQDGDEVAGSDWTLTALWTPGHIGNHLCFAGADRLFSGDHVMGWASTMISPPDGDLTDFMTSAHCLANRTDRIFYPGHGAPIEKPNKRLRWLIAHRTMREAEILRQLQNGPQSVAQLTRAIYTDVQKSLLPAAERNVLAHLIDLHRKSTVMAAPNLSQLAKFSLA